jgi:hypothetical protein
VDGNAVHLHDIAGPGVSQVLSNLRVSREWTSSERSDNVAFGEAGFFGLITESVQRPVIVNVERRIRVPVAMEPFLVQRGDAGDVKGHADGGLEK